MRVLVNDLSRRGSPESTISRLVDKISLPVVWRDGLSRVATLGILIVAGLILGACAKSTEALPLEVSSDVPAAGQDKPEAAPQGLVRVDNQGAVEVAATPISLTGEPNDTLDFELSMNTHSVDLSMDLAELSTLETDVGAAVSATSWSGGSGHHVRGLLVFPASAFDDGNSFLEGASRITLTIRDVDAVERVFVWDLPLAP